MEDHTRARCARTHGHTPTHPILHSKRCKFAKSVTFLNLYCGNQLANHCLGVCVFSLPNNKGDSFLFITAFNITVNR
jgi:hypothetical protein